MSLRRHVNLLGSESPTLSADAHPCVTLSWRTLTSVYCRSVPRVGILQRLTALQPLASNNSSPVGV
jgi:hypothetical protein